MTNLLKQQLTDGNTQAHSWFCGIKGEQARLGAPHQEQSSNVSKSACLGEIGHIFSHSSNTSCAPVLTIYVTLDKVFILSHSQCVLF